MKAIIHETYGSPDVLELRDVETPIASDGQVLVRVRAASANPLDWHFLRGEPFVMWAQFGLRVPRRTNVGNDVAGVVEAVGKNVSRFKPGDEVFGDVNGSFAEYVAAPEELLESKPANLTFEQAAAVPVAALTALQGLRDKGGIRAGRRVLIIGASGGVGTFAVQIAKTFDAHVTGVCSTRNVDMVRSIGADAVVDYTKEDFAKRGETYDVIFQLAGTASPLACRRALTPKGTLLLSSGESSGRWIGPLSRILEALVESPFVGQQLVPFIAKRSADDLRVVKGLIEAGKVTPVVDRTYPLREAPDAVRYVEAGHTRGKVVLTVADS
jgi:NADPH:quinone reductase-like Zn-dependent oxidoreductase